MSYTSEIIKKKIKVLQKQLYSLEKHLEWSDKKNHYDQFIKDPIYYGGGADRELWLLEVKRNWNKVRHLYE